jgi:hypothetical protein
MESKGNTPVVEPRSEPKTVTASRSTVLLTEAEAIRLAQAGDAAAFDHLYQLHGRRVYACVCTWSVFQPMQKI